MAAAFHTRPPTFNLTPSTPPRYQSAQVSKTGSNNSDGYSKSPSPSVDSGIEDEFGSPGSDISTTVFGDAPLELKADKASDDKGRQLMASNPFDNEKTRILFNAVDQLRKWNAHEYVEIPQLVIVGGQSSGKSSILRGLTDIPFPVSGKCCTRFPTRIVCHRTGPSTRKSYKISIEAPEVSVNGLDQLTKDECKFTREGTILTEEIFSKVINDIGTDLLGIDNPSIDVKRSFISNVLKVELFGPELSPLSILDLPGIISAANSVKEEEKDGVREMAIEYMKQSQNIIICVVSAHTDIDHQEILKLALETVDPHRLVGVLTQCDRADTSELKSYWSRFALNQLEDVKGIKDNWFVVRNRRPVEPVSFDIVAVERQIFSTMPWSDIPKNRRGTSILKAHIADILSEKLRSQFPKIKSKIEKILANKEGKRFTLGEPRTDHASRQKYIVDHLDKMQQLVQFALYKPALIQDETMRLRPIVSHLNTHFDACVRSFGHTWSFATNELPGEVQQTPASHMQQSQLHKPQPPTHLPETLRVQADFRNDFSTVLSPFQLFDEISDQFQIHQASQLPGVINPDIYPVMNNKQTQKWESLSLRHLECVYNTTFELLGKIFNEVCPGEGSTHILHNELGQLVSERLKQTYEEAKAKAVAFCKARNDPQRMLLSHNPKFVAELERRDHERYRQAAARAARKLDIKQGALKDHLAKNVLTPELVDELIRDMYEQVHHKKAMNMVLDVHDVLQVYYELSVEHFISFITDDIVEGFIFHEKGPLKTLNAAFIRDLPESTIDQIAREDDTTLSTRKKLDRAIINLRNALRILNEAHEQTR